MQLSNEQLLDLQQTIFQQPMGQYDVPQLAQAPSHVTQTIGNTTDGNTVCQVPAPSNDKLDAEVVNELASWIRCAAILGQVAASVATQACYNTVRQDQDSSASSAAVTHTHGRSTTAARQQQEPQQHSLAEQALQKASQALMGVQLSCRTANACA